MTATPAAARWLACNKLFGTPDLRGKFVIGAGRESRSR
jgi:hypothetical protein